MRCFSMRVKGQRKISLVLSLLIGFILIAGAAVAVPVPVLALSAGGIKSTIASIVISLLLQTGVAPTNTQWLNQLNNAYGVTSTIGTIEDAIASGLLTQTAEGLVDTGLSTAISEIPEYTSLGLSDIFTTTVSDAGVVAASGATNLASTAINVGTLGTIGAFAGAAAIGVGAGILANKFINWAGDAIRAGISYFQKPQILNQLGYGSSGCGVTYNNGNTKFDYLLPADCQGFYYTSGSLSFGEICSKKEPFTFYSKSGNNTWSSQTVNGKGLGITYYELISQYGFIRCNDINDYNDKRNNYKNGSITYPKISPDVITPQGNAEGVLKPDVVTPTSPSDYNYPGIGNIVPSGYDLAPVDMDDYNDYVVNANQNTEDGLTGENNQGSEFTEFINPYIVPYEEPLPDPKPDEPLIPEYPDEIPEYPDRPVTPDQPVIPDKPEIPNEDVETNLDLTTTPDLRGIFPFCIPWDIYNLVLIFDTGENRQAPHITFTFPGTDWVIDVDLAAFDPVAGILRLLELILFIVGLMVATRSLIGAGG